MLTSSSDVVVLTVPFATAFELAPQFLDGKIVIDTNHYYPDRDGSIDALDRRETKTSQLIANHFQGATIIKAFKAILEKTSSILLHALPIGGDDAANKVIVTTLQADFGFDTVDVGPLADSWRFERAKPAYCIPLDKDGVIAALAAEERDKELPEGSWRR
ncbi:Putative dinucleotide-binding enzyme (fragment) [Agrobacterium fabacearum S56]|uniref:NADPH-dependent F420 reductase n=1 Tax=Agrobacterium tumefaciens TaxID=358 RepID=UPI0009BC42A1